jgi:hypothetical protein
MKRDIELIRAILLKVEEIPIGQTISSPLKINEYDEDIIAEHVRLLYEQGYIDARIVEEFDSYDLVGSPQVESYTITRLLNDGHDFIADTKNPTVWKKTLDSIASKGGDVSLAIVKTVAAKIVSGYFG